MTLDKHTQKASVTPNQTNRLIRCAVPINGYTSELDAAAGRLILG